MVYARLASGYRAGGPNAVPGVPTQYNPDKTENYELGAKGDFLNHILSFDASIYYIDWKDIQLNLINPLGVSYNANGARAKSEGVELSVEARPLTGLTLTSWVWDGSSRSSSPPPIRQFGASGDRLPDAGRFSATPSFQQEFPLAREFRGFVGGALSYVGTEGTTASIFSTPPMRQYYAPTPTYAQGSLSGLDRESLADNITDRRGVLSGGIDFPTFAFKYVQPRTVGVSIARKFWAAGWIVANR